MPGRSCDFFDVLGKSWRGPEEGGATVVPLALLNKNDDLTSRNSIWDCKRWQNEGEKPVRRKPQTFKTLGG